MTYEVRGVDLLPLPEPVLEPSRELNDRLLRFYVLHLLDRGLRRAFLKPAADEVRA